MFVWMSQEQYDAYKAAPSLSAINTKLDTLKTQLTEINAAIAVFGKLSPDQQAKLNKIFDIAAGDSAKIDDIIP